MRKLAEFMANHRIFITWIFSLLFFFLILFSRPLEERLYHEILEELGYVLIAMAAMGRLWCGLYISGRKNKELCKDGPYSMSRNPLYVFSFLGAVGVSLGAHHLPLSLAIIPLFWAYYGVVVYAEEQNLKRIFGSEFESYCAQAPRFIPRFRNYWTRTQITINPRSVFKSMKDVMWLMIIIFLLEYLEHLKSIKINGATFIPTFFQLPF
ncbi:MAG: isoprenylcysteine carboxylmethyltransferase family protein [Elusimicrobia bacterium]|nr:isoprenylcysteine carboxylmethyltransferase family protein [Candidatus Obscuribacterium magneticum]